MFREIRYLKYQSSDIMVIGEPPASALTKSFHNTCGADETEGQYIWLLTFLSSICPGYYSPGCHEDCWVIRGYFVHQSRIYLLSIWMSGENLFTTQSSASFFLYNICKVWSFSSLRSLMMRSLFRFPSYPPLICPICLTRSWLLVSSDAPWDLGEFQ